MDKWLELKIHLHYTYVYKQAFSLPANKYNWFTLAAWSSGSSPPTTEEIGSYGSGDQIPPGYSEVAFKKYNWLVILLIFWSGIWSSDLAIRQFGSHFRLLQKGACTLHKRTGLCCRKGLHKGSPFRLITVKPPLARRFFVEKQNVEKYSFVLSTLFDPNLTSLRGGSIPTAGVI
jgi:hypothetical protein